MKKPEARRQLKTLDAGQLAQVIGGGNTEPLPWLPPTTTITPPTLKTSDPSVPLPW